MNYQHYFFDFDGTLADSKKCVKPYRKPSSARG